MRIIRLTTVALLALILCSAISFALADVANLSGTWKLNAARSDWGKKPAPQGVVITIVHQEPAFKYSGSTQVQEASPSKFSFEGAIDGKDYALKDDEGDRRIRFTRKSGNTIVSTQWSRDGKEEQSATTALSRDGKTLSRKIRAKSPDGSTVEWTEIYEKQ